VIYVEAVFDDPEWYLWIHVGEMSFEKLLVDATEEDAKRIAKEVAKTLSTSVARVKEAG
jgi:hypothetical protein